MQIQRTGETPTQSKKLVSRKSSNLTPVRQKSGIPYFEMNTSSMVDSLPNSLIGNFSVPPVSKLCSANLSKSKIINISRLLNSL